MFVLLDNSSGTGQASRLFIEPKGVVAASMPGEVPAALVRIEAATRQGLHAAGFLSYELGYALEPRLAARMPNQRRLPLLWFGLFETPRIMNEADLEAFLTSGGTASAPGPVTPDWGAEAYRERFARAHENIAAGDIYQLNLTFKMRFEFAGSPLAYYRELRRRQPVAHGALVDTGDATILSLSPEQFFARDGNTILSRPMKGTAARGATTEADALARTELASDPKQRAENLMIVDLMRNDIGRMAEIGSVSVSDLFTVETFRTVHQMTSGVTGRLRPGVGLGEMLTALFPPGSVTGAPKIRAMELIADLESDARGVYCGAIGFFGPNNQARLNVAIRTPVIFRDGCAEMGIGSGVVADSKAAAEYDECLLKMKFLAPEPLPFELIETLLHGPDTGYWLLERHLERLRRSAAHFGFVFHEADIRAALADAALSAGAGQTRVRLLVASGGTTRIAVTPLGLPLTVMHYVYADAPVASSDPFLAHKTTNRQRYDEDWRRLAQARGADDVLYVNERGELTEGSRTNLFVERAGRLHTPPLQSGVLPGVLRAELIANGRAREAVLTPADLTAGAAVFLGNSVRGLVMAEACRKSP